MAIVKMSKFNLYSLKSDRKNLLKAFQNFHNVHFNDIKSDDDYLDKPDLSKEVLEIDENINKAKFSIETLENFCEKKSSLKTLKEGVKTFSLDEIKAKALEFDFIKNYEIIRDLTDKKLNLQTQNQNLLNQIEELIPWYNLPYSFNDLRDIKKIYFRLGTLPIRNFEKVKTKILPLNLCEIEEIGRDKNFVYIAIFCNFEVKDEFMDILNTNSFTKFNLYGKNKISEEIKMLKDQIFHNELSIENINKQLKSHLNLLEDFKIYFDYLTNLRLKTISQNKFLATKEVDLIEGYIPTDRVTTFKKLLDDTLGIYYEVHIEPAKIDDPKVPIKLKNNKVVEPFESITKMYSMPKYGEIDPTPLFAPFYFTFAGIMVGDLGYGILVALICFIALKTFNLNSTMKNNIKFFMFLGISSMFWGLIFGSFFGDLGEQLGMVGLISPASDYVQMIGLSIILGIIQIFFALGVKAYMNIRDKKFLDAIFDVGFWYMAIIGSMVLIATAVLKISGPIKLISQIVMIVGMIGILLTGGRTEKSTGAKFGWGLYALYGITSYYGDFISYFRLMALALSGTFIAVAVNIIVKMLMDLGILGMIVGAIIFIVFQLFNVFLSFLSAYVHSARLTYVEMFNKFYEGGGIAFKDMIEQSKYFNIKEEI